MVPSAFVFIDALPLMPNGKIDREKLPLPNDVIETSEIKCAAPRTSFEKILAGIWSELLGIDGPGINDNFFDLGGHSLLATQVMSRLKKLFQVEIPLRSLFENPTIAGLAEEFLLKTGEPEKMERMAALLLKVSELTEDEASSMLAGGISRINKSSENNE